MFASILAVVLAGSFALAGSAPTTTATLVAAPAVHDPLEEHLTIALRRPSGGGIVRRYDVDMTKLLHLVIVSDDLGTFLHVHPHLDADGRFTLDQRFPRRALYHVYADAEPHGLGHQVFRFDLAVAGGGPAPRRDLTQTGARVRVGPYTVVLDRMHLRAGAESLLDVHVFEAGRPARDLRPYLGALAHAVFVNGSTLTYAHVHPMPLRGGSGEMDAMPGMTMPAMPALAPDATVAPDMQLHVVAGAAGTYKLWLQFRGGRELYVAPFVLTAA